MQFLFEERPSDSPLIEKIWHTHSEQAGSFTSMAACHSEIVITRYVGRTTITVRGPETKATPADVPADAEFLGIVFKLGTFMPTLLPKHLADRRDAYLPAINNRSFYLDSSTWEIPTFENADTFVARLVRQELLAHDPLVNAVLHGHSWPYSPRTIQQRFVRATGLPHKRIQQIERARQAFTLLQHGMPSVEAAYELGYFDQSHLTNALKRFVGQTPASIARRQQPA